VPTVALGLRVAPDGLLDLGLRWNKGGGRTGSRIEYAHLSTSALAAPTRCDDDCLMTNDPSRARRLALLRWALLAFAVLASAAAATVVGFAAYLFSQGYTGGGDPQSVAPLALPLSFLVLVVVGLPASFVCAGGWIGYFAVARNSRKPSK
jgi:hypothetical protein